MISRYSMFLGFLLILTACGEEVFETPNRVLIIGNSITYHPPDHSVGWNGNWGMAASSPEFDFVSVLTDSLRKQNPAIEILKENVYPFEREYYKMDWERYSYLREFEADLLIIRLGENVDRETLALYTFKDSLKAFVAYLCGGRKTEVIITTTFWDNQPVNEQLLKAGKESGWHIVPISFLSQEEQNMALGEYDNGAVARHPNDLGMKKIANLIWEGVKKVK